MGGEPALPAAQPTQEEEKFRASLSSPKAAKAAGRRGGGQRSAAQSASEATAADEEGCVPGGQVKGTEMHCVLCCAPGAMVVFPLGQAAQSPGPTPPSADLKVPRGQGCATLAPAPA